MHESRPAGPHLSVWTGDGVRELDWDAWRRAVLASAAGLRARGVETGSRVGAVLTNTPDACHAVIGTWLAGGTLVSLPTIGRGMSAAAYGAQLAAIAGEARLDCVLADGAWVAHLPPAVTRRAPAFAYESLTSSGSIDPVPPEPDEIAFVQYSSGTTSEPRGCCLTAGAIQRHSELFADRLDLEPGEQAMLWLPLSHDLGLFCGLILSFGAGMRLWLGTPQRFLRSPRTWIEDCAAVGASLTAAPNFALELAARAASVTGSAPAPIRRCGIAGEAVRAETLERAVRSLAAAGLREETLMPGYGLAEAVGMVTARAGPARAGPSALTIERNALLRGQVRPLGGVQADGALEKGTATTLVSCGPPGAGVTVRIAGTADVGEIHVRSPALASGYLSRPELTQERFAGDELRTRDLGFLYGGELYVVGRDDDMLMVAGSKVWARDLEALAHRVEGVKSGSCVLVDLPRAGTSTLVMLAEPTDRVTDFSGLARAIARTVRAKGGIQLAECLVVPRGTVAKTPSGKAQRYRCRELIAAGDMDPLGSASG